MYNFGAFMDKDILISDDIFIDLNAADITPLDFEKYCFSILDVLYSPKKLDDYKITHNETYERNDGKHQIDVVIEYSIANARNKVFVECKRKKNSIEIGMVRDLYQKIQSCGANKGIFISTSGYQKGAIIFAKEHGIALYRIMDRCFRNIQNSAFGLDENRMYILLREQELLPKYSIHQYDQNGEYLFNEVYPTQEMKDKVHKIIQEELVQKEV